jgi:hypothetical protein
MSGDPNEWDRLNELPTSFDLEDEQIDLEALFSYWKRHLVRAQRGRANRDPITRSLMIVLAPRRTPAYPFGGRLSEPGSTV